MVIRKLVLSYFLLLRLQFMLFCYFTLKKNHDSMFAWRLTVMVFASFVYFVYDELVKGFIFIIIFQNLNRFIDFRGNYYKFIKCLLFFVCFFFFARIHSENQCACKQFISATIIDQLIYWHMSPNTHFPLVCHRKCINCAFEIFKLIWWIRCAFFHSSILSKWTNWWYHQSIKI